MNDKNEQRREQQELLKSFLRLCCFLFPFTTTQQMLTRIQRKWKEIDIDPRKCSDSTKGNLERS